MQRLVHNIQKNDKGSTGLRILMWSLLFFLTFLASCRNTGNKVSKESESLAVALAEIRMMDSCRVTAHNREFYLHKYKAEHIIEKYADRKSLSNDEQRLLTKAKSSIEFAYSDYLTQVGKYAEAYDVMHRLAANNSINLYSDTTQWLRFLYHQGIVHYRPYNIKKNRVIILQGYDSAVQGYILASRLHDDYYKGEFMRLLSMYFINDSILAEANRFDRASIRYINEDDVPDSLLAGNLAERSVSVFLKLNRPYNTAQSWLALARCYFKVKDARQSIQCLNMALANPVIDSMPDLRASICEQLSLSYAAMDDKHNSDLYRNEYLDLQDSTRQDRELEARVEALQDSTRQLWQLVSIAAGIFVILCVVTLWLMRVRKKKEKKSEEEDSEIEELQEELQTIRLQYSNAMRSAVEQRARLSIVTGMIPLIDRMGIAIGKHDYEYTKELADEIERQNAMITQWIKMRKGVIQPRIEIFRIDEILNVVCKNTSYLASQNITLLIEGDCGVKVKADRSLTLFVINTLVDNARKAVGTHGTITITCKANESEGYAEVSVADTGKGMTVDDVAHLFEYKTIHDSDDVVNTQSHGFGLVNCRGIIDRYRKISAQFSVCGLYAESALNKGTRIFFRLPLVIKLLCLLLLLPCGNMMSANETQHFTPKEKVAARYCDSLYKCNVEGRYEEAMLYADSCNAMVNGDSTVDVGIRLSLYNETAVAALALHQWHKYAYFNYYYTKLYKEYTADSTLPSYCQTMEQNAYWANVAIIVMVILLLSLFPIFWFVYLRHVFASRKKIQNKKKTLVEESRKVKLEFDRLHVINNITDNQLSTLKHETMYYPVRIRQLASLDCEVTELQSVTDYYRELYKTLALQAMNRLASTFSFKVEIVCLSELFTDIEDKSSASSLYVMTNRELIAYLRLLLRRHNGGKRPCCSVAKYDKDYVTLDFVMSNNSSLVNYCNVLFSTDTPNVDFLIMRQIIREMTNTSLRYAAGITAFIKNEGVVIQVVMPLSIHKQRMS